MDVVSRVKGILVAPEAEWAAIEKEPGTPGYLFSNYVVYLAAIPPVAGFIGSTIIGVAVPGIGTVRVPLFLGLLGAVIGYLLSFLVVYGVAIIVDQLAPRFGGAKDFSSALKLTVYAFTPYWLGGIFYLMAGLRFVGFLAALYGLYLLWTGLPRLMRAPPDRAVAYVASAAACAFAIMLVLGLVLSALVT
jgi:Yip1 domain